MKKTLLFKLLAFSLFALLSVGVVNAQVSLPHYDGFDYTVSEALTIQAGYSVNSSGTDDILIAGGNLLIDGLEASTGNKISFAGGGTDVAKAVVTQAAGTVFYSFILNVTDLGTLNAVGGYFTGFGQTTTAFGATVWTGLDGTGYKIGINPRTSTSTNMVWAGGTQTLNNSVFIVVSYQFVDGAGNDIVNIWVNPSSSTFGGVTAPAATATATNLTGTDLTGVAQVFIRQDSDTETPTMEMDELRVGTTWAEVTPAAASTNAADLFFSEYVEGSGGNDRAFEIFNGTGAPVDLSTYNVQQSHNGEGWGTTTEYITPLSGTLADGDVYVVYNSTTLITAISSVGDLALTYLNGCIDGCKNTSFTGNDAMGLFKNGVLIDVIGVPAELTAWAVAGVATATQDHTLVRKNTVTGGTADWSLSAGTNANDSEWVVYTVNYFDDLGTHTFGEVVDVTAPNFTGNIDDNATEVAVDTKIIVTFDEPIRNIDNSEITDDNVAALLTLKETDASGANVPFTATIDATKKIITATPSASLKIAQLYYVAIVPVEDISDNATTGGNSTFTTITKYNVTFNVDMSLVKGFDPLKDTLYIAGNLAGWAEPGKNLDLQMKDPDGNMIYTIVLGIDLTAVPVVSDIAYKFFINAGWNTWGEWVGDPNRLATITANTTLNAIFGHKGGPVFVNVPYVQDFEYATANTNIALAGWTNANIVTGGTANWSTKEYTANKYGQVTSYGATSTGADQMWLITPGIMMSNTVLTDLTFDVKVGYYTHDGLTVKISTNYDQTVGGITTATWTDVTRDFVIPSEPATGYGPFTNAGHLDVSAYTGTMYVAFVYDGNKSATETTTYQLDNVAVNVVGYVGITKLPSSEINIYPNPSNGKLLISNPSNTTQEIDVFNAVGKKVSSAISAKGITSLDITTQPKGFYLVKITNKADKSVQFKKIILN